jgi:predicted Zn-dependent protease
VGTGAVLALVAAIGVGVLRRVLRMPALADVEHAIEEGEYRRAAHMAGRILSRLPGSEEALLGRAIALSKHGDNQAVVAELSRHLAAKPASDGTLHYVLGLAQLEVGRKEEAQASLKEAVRLTPSLQAEVAPRLGKVFSSPVTTTKETHGYA